MQRILVIGSGYAGFYAAWNLEKRTKPKEAQITIVEPRPYMTYQPFLPEVVAGSVEARHVAISLRSNLRRTRVISGQVTSITHADKQVIVELPDGSSRVLDYDVGRHHSRSGHADLPDRGHCGARDRPEDHRGGGGHSETSSSARSSRRPRCQADLNADGC